MNNSEELKMIIISKVLFDAFEHIEELKKVLTELQVFLNDEGILPNAYYFGDEGESEHWGQ